MNRKDIETFGEIQNRLRDYCGKVLATLAENYPEVGISNIDRVIGIDIIIQVIREIRNLNRRNRKKDSPEVNPKLQ